MESLAMRVFQIWAVVSLLSIAGIPVAQAQDVGDIPDIKAEDVSVGQVVSFVNAMIAVERVRKDYLTRIEAAESEDEINTLVADADVAAMAEVDRVAGITPGEYIAITRAAQNNEELTARINARIDAMRQSQTMTIEPVEKPEEEQE
jgi:hypothetical protein